jgi:hypothetical protein
MLHPSAIAGHLTPRTAKDPAMPLLRFTCPLALALMVALAPIAKAEALASALADGQPWTTTTPEGRKMTLTLYPDGTARMKMGIMGRNLTWQPTEDGLCLIGTPRGDACLRLEKTATGYVGYRGQDPMLTLTR